MDSVDICAATSTADNCARLVHKPDRDWLKRLHLRKTALQPSAMQSPDKPGPKKIIAAAAATEATSTDKLTSTAWQSSNTPQSHESAQRTVTSAQNTLRFKCPQCTDNTERAAKDLLKHFDEKHQGCPPVFSCQTCKFTTHELSYLQVHVLSHKETFSCCSLCNDDVQRTWAEFSAHLTMFHTRNGKYLCEVCKKFSTSNDKEFLEHVLLHNLGLDMKNDQAICKATHSCQFCGFEASQKVLLAKHVKAAHGSANCNQKNKLFPINETKKKSRMTRSAVKDISWLTQDCLSLPGHEFLDKYCHLSDAQTTLEETQQFLIKSGKRKWSKALKDVLTYVPQEVNLSAKMENAIAHVLPDSSQDVLTVKNKINHQNGTGFAKRLKLMTEKEVEKANADLCGRIVGVASLNDCLQKQENTASQVGSTENPQTEENRENQRLKMDLNERNDGSEEMMQNATITNDLKALETKSVRKAVPKKKRKNMRWKNVKKTSRSKLKTALALKIVLKKNPQKGKQWVTQTSKTVKCSKTSLCEREAALKGNSGPTNTADRQTAGIQNGGRPVTELERVLVNGTKGKSEDFGGSDGTPALFRRRRLVWRSLSLPLTVKHPTQLSLLLLLPHTFRLLLHPLLWPFSSPPAFTPWTPIPKNLERTLHLVAINPNSRKEALRRTTVVVLNHPT
ncbi:hypothetical protein WMY93_017981 [Mugilogobius chulae]|uniref:C2H2-type domain-containing protein n=1 Tax=Mugilogobius chulae TaxID=88201 RepID=A0AAW0NMG4_9GOBI